MPKLWLKIRTKADQWLEKPFGNVDNVGADDSRGFLESKEAWLVHVKRATLFHNILYTTGSFYSDRKKPSPASHSSKWETL